MANQALYTSTKITDISHSPEKADTTLLLHVPNSVSNGLNKLMVGSMDTNVLVLMFRHLLNASEPWIALPLEKETKCTKLLKLLQMQGLESHLSSFDLPIVIKRRHSVLTEQTLPGQLGWDLIILFA